LQAPLSTTRRIVTLTIRDRLSQKASSTPFEFSEQEVDDYVDRAVLGFEPLLDVFPAIEKAGTVPFWLQRRRSSPTGGIARTGGST
jgi:hypothetical protein